MLEEQSKEKSILSEKPEAGARVEAGVEKAPTPEIRKEVPLTEEIEAEISKPPRRHVPFFHKKPSKPQAILETAEATREIEEILSDGLEDVYQNLPENLKGRFREKGRETASQIEKIISGAKIAAGKILDLIKKWLVIIPGINKFFLEQESKIKTDKILGLAERKRKQKIQL